MLLNAYSGKDRLEEAIEYSKYVLETYVDAENIKIKIIEKE